LTGPSGAGKTTVGGLVASALERSAHIRVDAFFPFVANGWVEPWLPEAGHQNDVLGGAVFAAAMQFAAGGYTVVLDGHLFPDVLDDMTRACARRGIPLHYVVLRADLGTCLARAASRADGTPPEAGPFEQLHARFDGLGEYEAHVLESTGPAEEVAKQVLAALRLGRFVTAVA
jgi:predicted kinase